MPFEVSWKKKGLYLKFTGKFDFQAIDSANREVYGDARVDNIKYLIWDAMDIDQAVVSEEQLDLASEDDKVGTSYLPNLKLALVGTDPELKKIFEYYVNRSMQVNSTWHFEIFDRLADAENWVTS